MADRGQLVGSGFLFLPYESGKWKVRLDRKAFYPLSHPAHPKELLKVAFVGKTTWGKSYVIANTI